MTLSFRGDGMSRKYRTLQTYILWAIDMACIIVSFLIASYIRYNAKADYGDKTLHYLVCVIFLLVGTIYTFLADWNRDFIVRGWFQEFLNVLRFVAFILLMTMMAVFFLQWFNILSRLVILHFTWIVTVLTYVSRVVFKEFFKKHMSSENNVTRVVVVAEKNLVKNTVKALMNRADSVGYKVVRAYAVDENDENGDDKESSEWYIGDVHVHKGIHNLVGRLITDPFDEVFINTPNIPQNAMKDIILGFEEMGVTTHFNMELPGISKAHTQFDDYMGYSVIT